MPKPSSSSTVAQIKSYIREKRLNQPELKLGLKKADLIKGLKKHGHWDARTATERSTRPAGQGGMAKRTGGAPGAGGGRKFVYPKSGNKPKGMTITQWRTDPKNKSRTREMYSGPSGVNPGRIGGDGKTSTKTKKKAAPKKKKLSKAQNDFLAGIDDS
tara:strand:- start:1684 stop:2157 length:474 start_codon:yes stop_codon:yes gene_type:complete